MSHFFSSLYYLCISLLCIWLSSVHVKVVLDRLLFELARKKFDPENSSVTCAISLTYSANNKMLLLCALLCYCCHLSRHLQSIFFYFFPSSLEPKQWVHVACSKTSVGFTGHLSASVLIKYHVSICRAKQFPKFFSEKTAEYKVAL